MNFISYLEYKKIYKGLKTDNFQYIEKKYRGFDILFRHHHIHSYNLLNIRIIKNNEWINEICIIPFKPTFQNVINFNIHFKDLIKSIEIGYENPYPFKEFSIDTHYTLETEEYVDFIYKVRCLIKIFKISLYKYIVQK